MEEKKPAVRTAPAMNAAPAVRAASTPAVQSKTDKKGKKKKKKGLGKVIFILLLLIIIGGAVLCYIMNYFGVKSMVVAFFIEQDDQYVTVMNALSEKQTELDEANASLDTREAELDALEEELNSKKTSLENQEASLTKQKTELNNEKALLQDVTVERAEVIGIINSMSADAAAQMLENYRSIYEVADVLAEIDEKKAAKIIQQFTPAMAAKITEQMLSLSEEVTDNT